MICRSAMQKANYIVRRHLAVPLQRAAHLAEPVLLEGPRGSGKTTLLRQEFPRRLYVTLADAAERRAARADPAAFLARLRGTATIDDVHRAPELVAHLARFPAAGPLLLAASRRLSLPMRTLRLYHPTRAELAGRAPLPIEMLGRFAPAPAAAPRPPAPWPARPEPDLNDLLQFRDLDRFELFRQLAFERSGQVLDAEKLARAAGVSRTTAVRWLGVLDACFQTVRLEPFDEAFGRRLVRAPKLHFLDSPALESAVVSEIYRNSVHAAREVELRYWRDSNGLEIPLVVQLPGAEAVAVSIVETPNPIHESRLRRWLALAGTRAAALITERSTPQHGPVTRYSLADL
jgi:predicted AAA+ superfamily ATPase